MKYYPNFVKKKKNGIYLQDYSRGFIGILTCLPTVVKEQLKPLVLNVA